MGSSADGEDCHAKDLVARAREMITPKFPKALRIEVKFTTGMSISVPKREREALLSKDPDVVGVIAALFCFGKRDYDSRWFIVDAAESFRTAAGDGGRLAVQDLQRIERGQAWLAAIHDHMDRAWPRFLRAFLDDALAGHEALCGELEILRRTNGLEKRISAEPVLELEHRSAVRRIVDHHGATGAGRIFQDLLAYLLALAGYRKVQLNAVGVPDIEVSDFLGDQSTELVTFTLTRQQAERLGTLAKAAGDDDLVSVFAGKS